MPQLPELVMIVIIVVIVIGASRIPDIGDALGRAVKNFRRAASGKEIDVTPRKDPPA